MTMPFVPDGAPFSEDQKAWLSGFLAGLQSRVAAGETDAGPSQPAANRLHILFGTQTGNAEAVAEDAAAAASQQGFSPLVMGMDDISMEVLAEVQLALVVISTYGEGEMPDNAELFWDALSASTAPRLDQMKYGVIALGDTGYDEFCHAGKLVDTRLEQLGAQRLNARVDCDVDFEEPASAWIEATLPIASELIGLEPGSEVNAEGAQGSATPQTSKSVWNRKNPYPAPTLENRLLSSSGSSKEIRHFAFDLSDSDLTYQAGDALGVMPTNDQALVDALLARLGADPEQEAGELNVPLGEALSNKFEIMTPSKALLEEVAVRSGDDALNTVLANGDKEALDAFLWGQDSLDLLNISADASFSADEFLSWLKPLQHRAYSISSSPSAHPGEVHLTVAAVRWRNTGRDHKGVCSTYLADNVETDDTAPVFVLPNKAFRVPANDDAPMIMVGPGTGIAPFRAFLEERRARGAGGRNWLFFGDQHRASDFIYEEEVSAMSDAGLLSRLDLAFSRDQSEKIYVQSRMYENARELFAWLEDGGHFYVCGDATRMARDVDAALHKIVEQQGGFSADNAKDYVSSLKREKRYLRDVY